MGERETGGKLMFLIGVKGVAVREIQKKMRIGGKQKQNRESKWEGGGGGGGSMGEILTQQSFVMKGFHCDGNLATRG